MSKFLGYKHNSMNVPTLAALMVAGAVAMHMMPYKSKIQCETHVSQQTPGGTQDQYPTMASQIWVDKAQNTALRNDTVDTPYPDAIDKHVKATYAVECAMHPGVRLVGQAVY